MLHMNFVQTTESDLLPRQLGIVRCGEGVLYLRSQGRPTEIGLQLGNACYPCSR